MSQRILEGLWLRPRIWQKLLDAGTRRRVLKRLRAHRRDLVEILYAIVVARVDILLQSVRVHVPPVVGSGRNTQEIKRLRVAALSLERRFGQIQR